MYSVKNIKFLEIVVHVFWVPSISAKVDFSVLMYLDKLFCVQETIRGFQAEEICK